MGIETLAAISIGGAVAGGGIGLLGSLFSGGAQKNAYNYQAQVAANNKVIADRNAQYAVASGETEAQISGMKTRAQIGGITAAQGASGLDVNSGSGVAVRESEAEIGSFNQMMIRANARKQAYGYEVEGMNQQAQERMSRQAGKNAMTAGIIGGASSVVGAASSVSDKWLKFGTAGVPGFA